MRTKKSLGQHFLSSPSYLRAIVDAAEIHSRDRVLEIGPGTGSLTRELLSRGAVVTAIEKDRRLIPGLKETFAKEIAQKQLNIIEADILHFHISKYGLLDGKFKLVANIPYYITGALFEKFLGSKPRPKALVFLVQKEVAERIARNKKESILSLSVKAYGEPHYIKTVPRGAFSPAPNVDSAIITVLNISTRNFQNHLQEKKLFELLHAGFAHKRKLLVRNLEKVLGVRAREALMRAQIPENARAEDISLTQWLLLL